MDEWIGWKVIEIVNDTVGPEAAEELRRLMKIEDPALVIRDAVAILDAVGVPISVRIARALNHPG